MAPYSGLRAGLVQAKPRLLKKSFRISALAGLMSPRLNMRIIILMLIIREKIATAIAKQDRGKF
jgi:hypothetical protein